MWAIGLGRDKRLEGGDKPPPGSGLIREGEILVVAKLCRRSLKRTQQYSKLWTPQVRRVEYGMGSRRSRMPAARCEPSMPLVITRRQSRPPFAGPYFGSTPPEAYFHPDRRTSRLTRAAAVKDGRHANREACSPLPGRSLRAASTAARSGGSGPEGATPFNRLIGQVRVVVRRPSDVRSPYLARDHQPPAERRERIPPATRP